MSQNGLKTTLLMTSLTKILQLQPKNFFQVQTRRLSESFAQLSSAIVAC